MTNYKEQAVNWNVRNIVERAVWTFAQSAVGSISVVAATAAVAGADIGTLRTIGLTALGAGVAALLSLCKNLTAEGIVVQAAGRTTAPLKPLTVTPGVFIGVESAPEPVPPKPRSRVRTAAPKPAGE